MQIPTNIYGLELLRWVCQTPELTTDDVVIREAIKHLCFPNMLVFDSQIFTEEQRAKNRDLIIAQFSQINVINRLEKMLIQIKNN
jgi:hypothetical protein